MSGHKKRHETTILSIGAAVQDVFLTGSVFEPHCEDKTCVAEFQLGSKNEIDPPIFSTGGGATNAAVTFARQGLHSYYMGKIGHDVAGKSVVDELHNDQVDTSLVSYSKNQGTGYSSILLAPSGERTIFTYRGASTHYELAEKDFHHVVPDWIYLSSLEGNFESIDTIFKYAEHHKIKVAMNPGKKELEQVELLKKYIPKLTILSMNKEEMQMLYKGDTIQELVKAANKDVHYVIVTDGPNGSAAADRWHLVTAGMYEDVPVIDRTGAGDAFSSGFTAMIAAGEILEHAVTFASANSTSVVGKIGAKAGIIHAHESVHAMPLSVVEVKDV
jgi:sugar/nucleoside kinase (ribokinase family)